MDTFVVLSSLLQKVSRKINLSRQVPHIRTTNDQKSQYALERFIVRDQSDLIEMVVQSLMFCQNTRKKMEFALARNNPQLPGAWTKSHEQILKELAGHDTGVSLRGG